MHVKLTPSREHSKKIKFVPAQMQVHWLKPTRELNKKKQNGSSWALPFFSGVPGQHEIRLATALGRTKKPLWARSWLTNMAREKVKRKRKNSVIDPPEEEKDTNRLEGFSRFPSKPQ